MFISNRCSRRCVLFFQSGWFSLLFNSHWDAFNSPWTFSFSSKYLSHGSEKRLYTYLLRCLDESMNLYHVNAVVVTLIGLPTSVFFAWTSCRLCFARQCYTMCWKLLQSNAPAKAPAFVLLVHPNNEEPILCGVLVWKIIFPFTALSTPKDRWAFKSEFWFFDDLCDDWFTVSWKIGASELLLWAKIFVAHPGRFEMFKQETKARRGSNMARLP